MLDLIKTSIKANREILHFSFISIIGNMLTAFVPLLIAKKLNPIGFGSYSLGMALIFFFIAFFVSSMQTPCIISASRELQLSNKINYTFSVLLSTTILTLISSVILVITLNQNIHFITHNSDPYLSIGILFGYFGYCAKSFSQTMLLGFDKKKSSAIVEAIFALSNLLFLLLLFSSGSLSLPAIVATYFPSGILTAIIAFFLVDSKKLLPLSFNQKYFSEIFHFAKWQLVGLTAIYFVSWGDNLILRLYTGIDKIGIYNLAYKFFGGLIIPYQHILLTSFI